MALIIDNKDPNRRPDAPVPSGLNKSVPSRSVDTIRLSGGLASGKPSKWGEFPNEVAVTFHELSRDRTWVNLAQFHTKPGFGGNYDEQSTEGVSTAVAVVQRWETTLGVEVTAGWGPFSAAMSATLSEGGEQSVTVDLFNSISRTVHFNFKEGTEAEVAAWQLEESYVLNNWINVWKTESGDPSQVTDAMIDTAGREIQKALSGGTKPAVARSYTLPVLLFGTNQYTMTSFPPVVGGSVTTS